jgi:ClpP class serine protease
MKNLYYETLKEELNKKLVTLEKEFDSDVIFFFGPIYSGLIKFFRDFVEDLKKTADTHNNLTIFLNSIGGEAETAEKLVEIIRFHYDKIYFVIPDAAFSAGTIFCLSGDKIYMDYSSSLGPIDPQIYNGQ